MVESVALACENTHSRHILCKDRWARDDCPCVALEIENEFEAGPHGTSSWPRPLPLNICLYAWGSRLETFVSPHHHLHHESQDHQPCLSTRGMARVGGMHSCGITKAWPSTDNYTPLSSLSASTQRLMLYCLWPLLTPPRSYHVLPPPPSFLGRREEQVRKAAAVSLFSSGASARPRQLQCAQSPHSPPAILIFGKHRTMPLCRALPHVLCLLC